MNEVKPPGVVGTADTRQRYYWYKYCFGRPPLLLTAEEVIIYNKLMEAVQRGPAYDIRKAFNV